MLMNLYIMFYVNIQFYYDIITVFLWREIFNVQYIYTMSYIRNSSVELQRLYYVLCI